jgi:hypothetical protein
MCIAAYHHTGNIHFFVEGKEVEKLHYYCCEEDGKKGNLQLAFAPHTQNRMIYFDKVI